MKRTLILLAGVALLYLIPSGVMKAVYGPSYVFPPSEDCWMPDGNGGWRMHGHPSDPQPDQPSVDIPMALPYVPIVLPTLLLVLFIFGPWKRLLHDPAPPDEDDTDESGDNDAPGSQPGS